MSPEMAGRFFTTEPPVKLTFTFILKKLTSWQTSKECDIGLHPDQKKKKKKKVGQWANLNKVTRVY